MIFALLPVKAAANAKQRLSAILTPGQRERLARLMYEQTLETLRSARGLERLDAFRGRRCWRWCTPFPPHGGGLTSNLRQRKLCTHRSEPGTTNLRRRKLRLSLRDRK